MFRKKIERWKNRLLDYLIPTTRNGYRAHLLSNSALASYAAVLIVFNLFFSNAGFLRPSYALLDVSAIVNLHNEERARFGLGSLDFNAQLAESARQKAEAMLDTDCWSHYCPDGVSPWTFFRDAGYVYAFAGENLAEGFTDSAAVMQAWMNSKTHRDNVLKGEFTEIGIAIAFGDYQGIDNNAVVVVHFGQPRNPNNAAVNSPEGSGESVDSTNDSNPQENSGGDNTSGSGELVSPRLIFPEPESFLNQPKPIIKGQSQSDVGVIVENRSTNSVTTRSGRISPEGGIFTFTPPGPLADGGYSVEAASADNSELRSPKVNFQVDTAPPPVSSANLSVVSITESPTGEVVALDYESSERLQNLRYTGVVSGQVFGEKRSDNLFRFELQLSDLAPGATLEATDLAGNSATQPIAQTDIDRLQLEGDSVPVLADSVQTSGSFIDLNDLGIRISSLSPVQLISLVSLAFLIILFALDIALIRRKQKQLKLKLQSNSAHHLPTFLALFFVVIVGNYGGSI